MTIRSEEDASMPMSKITLGLLEDIGFTIDHTKVEIFNATPTPIKISFKIIQKLQIKKVVYIYHYTVIQLYTDSLDMYLGGTELVEVLRILI